MFCQKCGTKSVDGAEFCQKCGAKLIKEESVSVNVETAPKQSTPTPAAVEPPISTPPVDVSPNSQPTQTQPQWTPSPQQNPVNPSPIMQPAPQKKKAPKWPFIVGGAVVVILAVVLVVIIGDIGSPKYDYEAMLRAYMPYAKTYDLPYTFGEVMDKYLENSSWTVDEKEDGQADVTVSGTLKGFGAEAVLTYNLTQDPEDSSNFKFKNESVTVNSEKSSWDGAKTWVPVALFKAYDSGDEELADITGLLVALGIYEPELTETYTNEDSGISLKYPSTWERPSGEDAEVFSSFSEVFGSEVFTLICRDKYLQQFNSFMGIYKSIEPVTPEDVNAILGNDDEFIDSMGFDPAVTETSVTKIGSVPARKVSTDLVEGMRARIYMYAVGSDAYTLLFVRGGKETEQLEHCFDAIMDTYTITVPEPTPTPVPTPSPTPVPTPTPEPTPVPKTPLDDITFRGYSLVQWCDGPADIAYDRFGLPDDITYDTQGTSWYDEGVVFYFDQQTGINTGVTVFSPSAALFNGSPMGTTRDEIINLLGSPDEEDTWKDTDFYLIYYYDEVYIEVDTTHSGLVTLINIWPY